MLGQLLPKASAYLSCYDNYQGHWGDQQHLDRFLQAYAVEKCRLEARRSGHCVTEQQLADGSVKLTIRLHGGVS